MRNFEPPILAYIVAGMVHFVMLLRHAFNVGGDQGRFFQNRLLRVRMEQFLGVVVTWPVAVWRGGRPWMAPETFAFVIAAVVLFAI